MSGPLSPFVVPHPFLVDGGMDVDGTEDWDPDDTALLEAAAEDADLAAASFSTGDDNTAAVAAPGPHYTPSNPLPAVGGTALPSPAAARSPLRSPAAAAAAAPVLSAAPAAAPAPAATRKRDSLAPSLVGAAPSAAAGSATGKSKDRDSGVLMFRSPLSTATIAVHGKEFVVHAELLCKDSAYFGRCLRGAFTEAATQRIALDDEGVAAEDVGLWVDLLYRWHFHRPGTFVLRKEETGGTLSTMQILTLWMLSDRFLHRPLAALAEESLQHRLSLYSAEQWRKLYRTRPRADIEARVARLQNAYRYCCLHALPFADAIVAACANCPAQVYADCTALLEPDFMAPVSRRMILAHADPALLSKDERAGMLAEAAERRAAQ